MMRFHLLRSLRHLAQQSLPLLLAWAMLSQLVAPLAISTHARTMRVIPVGSAESVWGKVTGSAQGESLQTNVDFTDAVLTRHAPTLNGGSVEGSVHVLGEDDIQLPADFPSSIPISTGTRTVTIKAQHAVTNIGNWETVRDLSVSGANITIDVPPGNYRTFTVNGNSRLRFAAGTYNFANTIALDGGASLQTTGLVTINIGQDLTINSGAISTGSYTSPGDVRLNVLGWFVNIKGSSQVTGLLRAYRATVTLNGSSQVRGQVIADRFVLKGGKVIGAVWPALTDSCYTIFGPRRFDRTTGQPNQYVEQFSLPANATGPFTLHVQNGADNVDRVSSATVMLNGVEFINPNDLNQNVGNLDRDIKLAGKNQMDVRLASEPGSYLIINICGVSPTGDTIKPDISISSPANNTITMSDQITVSGTAADDGGIAHVYVNNVEASYNSGDGLWSIDNISLALGENQITARAVDDAGNDSSASIVITRESPPNKPPTADAGIDQTLALPHTALLQGCVNDDGLPDGSSLTVSWSMVSGPGTVTFSDAATLNPSASFSEAGTYVLRLSASDSDLNATDDVTITVQPQNQPPTVTAGPDQTIALPQTAALNGTVTDDGWPAGSNVTSLWSKVSGPGNVTFEDAGLPQTVASFSEAGIYVLRLTATDGELSSLAEVTVIVHPQNQAPSVNAGADQIITLPNAAQLNGVASDDGWPTGSSVSATWTTVSGPAAVVFDDVHALNTIGRFSLAGTYVLRLTGHDTELFAADEITITVIPQNLAPIVDAGPDQPISLPNTANLNGSGSDDGLPAGGVLAIQWSKVSGPGTVVLADASMPSTTASFSEVGTYVLRLAISDGEFTTFDELTITVTDPRIAPVADFVVPESFGVAGAFVIASSGAVSASFAADRILDNNLTTFWSTSVISNQFVTLQLFDQEMVFIDRIRLQGPNGASSPATVKDFEIQVSSTDANDTSFTTVLNATLLNTGQLQEFQLPAGPSRARFIRFVPKNNYGHSGNIQLATFNVAAVGSVDGLMSLPGQTSVALSQSPSLIANGGAVYTSTYVGGSVTANGLLGYNDGGWAPALASKPYVIIQLAGGEPYTIKGVKLANATILDSQTLVSAVRNFEVWVSSTTTDDAAFTKVLTATATVTPAFQTFLFPPGPVQARYIKYLPLTNGGGPTVHTHAFDVITENVGRVVAVSGESQSNFNPVEAAFDADPNSIWFSPGGATTNVWVKTSLFNEETRKVYGVRIFPVNDFATGQRGPKDFDIRVSTTTADDAAFTTVYSGTLAGTIPGAPQEFIFSNFVDAKYVQFFWKTGYSTFNIGVRTLEVLAAPDRGAALVGFSSQEEAASNVLDLNPSNQWVTALNQPASQWMKLVLPRADLATLHHIALRPAIATNGSYSAPKDFELQVSTSDIADASFSTVLAATLANSTQLQDFYFPPVQARYVRLLLKNNYGGGGRYGLAGVHLYSGQQIGTTTRFIDRSSDADGSIVSWLWDFGDGTISAEQHPTHTFLAPGQYTVSLTVKDNSGLSHTRQSAYRVVTSTRPDFAFSPVIAHEGGESVRFIDLTRLLADVNPARRFDFGDGTSVTQSPNVSLHRFDDSGTFPVTLRLTDALGIEYSVTNHVVVRNLAPTVDIDPGKTLVWGQQWTSVPRIEDQSPIDRLTLQGQWSFGDSQTSQCVNCTNANAAVTHTYSYPGSYTAVLTVTDKDGASGTDSATFNVNKRPVNLAFQNIATPQIGQPVLLRVRLTDSFANQPLGGRVIQFALNGISASASTDANGFAEASVTFAAGVGVNTAIATFAEEEFYLGGTTYRVVPGVTNQQTCTRTSAGTDYWLMFPGNHIESGPGPNEGTFLDISSQVATTGTVTIPGLNITKPFAVAANSTTRVQVNTEVTNNNVVENRGIHVVSQQPVTVYGLNNQFSTVDAYLGLPTASLGNNYVVLGYANGGILKGTQFGIVASTAATTVTITPSVTVGSRTIGVPYNITLNQGQTYMLRDDVSQTGDLSGTLIQSGKPIAVFGGHKCANIPAPASYCDYVIEQLPPADTWGTHFATLPLATRTKGDTFRFLAATDNTHIFLNSSRIATLSRGQFFETIIEGPGEIASDYPILVAQYSNSHQYDNAVGDPFMILVPPLNHYLNAYTVTSFTGFNVNRINVIAPTSGIGAVLFDGAPIAASAFVSIGATGVSGAQLTVSAGTHNLSGPHPFGVYVYGFGLDVSYGYPGSVCLATALGPTTITLTPKSQDVSTGAQACVTATVKDQNNIPVNKQDVALTITGAHPQMLPVLVSDELGQAQLCYSGNTAGDDLITATSNGSSDAASVTWQPPNQAPAVNAGADQIITLLAPVSLSGSAIDDGLPSNALSFSWTTISGPGTATFVDASTASTLATFDTAGVYVLRLSVSDGELSGSDEVQVTVNPAPPNAPPEVHAGLDQSTSLNANLLVNGGNDQPLFGSDIVGWTGVAGSRWTKGSSSSGGNFPQPQRGDGYFFAGEIDYAELRQDVDVSAYDADVDAGTQVFEFKAYVRSALEENPDSSQLVVEYRDAANATVIASLDSGEISSTDAWHLTEDARIAPIGTRWIRIRLIAKRNGGATNDAFFDSISLRPINNSAITLNGSATDDGLPYSSSLSVNWTRTSGPAPVTFATGNTTTSAAIFTTAGTYVLRLTATDGEATVSDDVTVIVNSANQPPVINSGPNQTITLPDSATLSGIVTDDGAPSASVSSIWSKVSGPGSVVFGDENATSTTASFSAAGTYVLRLTADDSEYSTSADVTIAVNPTQTNQPPTVDPGSNQTISLPTDILALNGVVADDGLPAGNTLTINWTKVSGPGVVTFGSPNTAITTAQFDAAGSYVLRLSASDGEYVVGADVGVLVTPQNTAPATDAGADQAILLSQTAQLDGSAADDGLPNGNVTTIWSKISGPGTVTFGNAHMTITGASFSTIGNYVLRLTASDGALNDADDVTITVVDDVEPPEVSIASPDDGVDLTVPASIIGSVSSGNWILEYSLNSADGAANQLWTLIGSGSGPVTNASLGTLDTTLMLNGVYSLRLRAIDEYGQTGSSTIAVIVDGNLKVGQLQMAFSDLAVPVAGIPIEVVRSYDSRNKRIGDFGVGWQLAIKSARIEKTGVLGFGWLQTASSGVIPTYCLEPARPHKVAVTFGDGRVFKFRASTAIHCQQFAPITATQLTFTAEPGTHATLESTTPTDVIVESLGAIPGPARLINQSNPDIYNTATFRLTTAEGAVYVIDQLTGVNSVRDPYGNTLTINSGGIVHSSGQSISFSRDTAGRITGITDPNGNIQTYTYDARGDLVSHKDREQNATIFTYNSDHHLLSITDARGVELMTNEYDASGRLIRQADAFNKSIAYDHDIPGRVETITDRLGNSTHYEYDERGNVLRVVDAKGGVKTFTYDNFDNVLTETNELGKTATYTYDAFDNRISVKDPLNNVTAFTYNAARQPLTVTDARGHVTTNTYDAAGTNLLTTTDGLGNITTFGYDIFTGQRTMMKDALGNVTQYGYDDAGHLSTETGALANVTAYNYDSNGNRTSQTVTRTNAQGQSENITTVYTYDKLNRLTNTTFADGSSTRVEYNAIGQQSATIDQLGHRTEYTYDDMGRLARTAFPDGTHEDTTYDAEGRRLISMDRAGHATSYTYDELGRLTKTTFADNTFTSTTYNAAGQVITQTDARGNLTRFEYDDAGRRTKVLNALNQETTFTYDANGNQLTITDALLRTTTYEYDANNRRTKTIYADGTSDVVAYDKLGRIASKTDQAGKTTQFFYDALGRLANVKDALNQETTYSYNELGQQTSQTDANNHTTRFEYDQLGRRVRRILPAGQFETYAHDAAGSLVARTDFNGKTTSFSYDVMLRVISKTPDPSLNQPAASFTYNASGQRATMNDASGATVYSYDVRNRLARKQTPFGKLSYAYDDAGNLLTTRSSNANGVSIDYDYDALNRLATVKDNNVAVLSGGTTNYTYDDVGNLESYLYPNGVTTSYNYNALNRLTSMTLAKGVSALSSYTYMLGPTGNRNSVTELGGRTVNYSYDDLYRLTRETIAHDPHAVNASISYTFDAVGNRLSRTSTVAGVPSQSATYDANDRLNSETYDSNGNTTAANGNTYAYDFENHLTSVNGGAITYVYDGDGNRVGKTAGGITTNYLVDTNNQTGYAQVVEELHAGAVTKQFTYGHDLISQRCTLPSANCTLSFYGYDGHASVRQLTDANGTVTDTYDYDAFGNLTCRSGTTANDYMYSGEQFDGDAGLYYLRARYLSPNTGRFLTIDSFEGHALDPRSLHKYTYVNNAPTTAVDPSGQFLSSIIGEINVLTWRTVLFAGQFQRTLTSASLLLKALDVGLTFGDNEYRDLSFSLGHNPFAAVSVLAADARLAFRYTSIGSEAPYVAERVASSPLNIVNAASSFPERELINFTKWSASPVVVPEGEVLYRVHSPGRSTGPWWTRVRPQSEIQFRIDSALRPEWNEAKELSMMSVPNGSGLQAWEGSASYQGGFYVGGGNQLFIPNVPPEWITTVPFK